MADYGMSSAKSKCQKRNHWAAGYEHAADLRMFMTARSFSADSSVVAAWREWDQMLQGTCTIRGVVMQRTMLEIEDDKLKRENFWELISKRARGNWIE